MNTANTDLLLFSLNNKEIKEAFGQFICNKYKLDRENIFSMDIEYFDIDNMLIEIIYENKKGRTIRQLIKENSKEDKWFNLNLNIIID